MKIKQNALGVLKERLWENSLEFAPIVQAKIERFCQVLRSKKPYGDVATAT